MERGHTVNLTISQNLDEDLVWTQHVAPILVGLPDNVLRICHYGFTEMFNNVIDHSEAESARVSVALERDTVRITVEDNGIGVFERMKRVLMLASYREALFELHKGKVTTDPARHSGQGIFFTSKVFDTFTLSANGLIFGHLPKADNVLMEDEYENLGTCIGMEIHMNSNRSLKSVFDEYSSVDEGFFKTRIVVALAKLGDDDLISRSQAKRVLANCEKFKQIVIDFQGVDFIGQAFADEIFRVFALHNPDVELIPIHENDQIRSMIVAAQRGPQPTPGERGRAVDLDLMEWRSEGMAGTPEQREAFLKQVYQGARFNLRAVLLAAPAIAPGKTPRELFESTVPSVLESVAAQARESGFDEEQTALYLETHRAAYRSLAEEFGFAADLGSLPKGQ